MKNITTAAFLTLICLVPFAFTLTGCSTSHRNSSMYSYSIPCKESMLGRWKSSRGDIYTISRVTGNDLRIDVLRGDGLPASPLKARVISIDGTSMLEVDFSGSSSPGTKAVPVYAYARVESESDSISYSPLNTQWLKTAVANNPDIAFGTADKVDPNAGGVVVRSPKAMAEILSRAAKDPAAFSTSEKLTRIN